MHRDVFWRIDADAHLIPFQPQDRDRLVVTDHHGIADPPCENQHPHALPRRFDPRQRPGLGDPLTAQDSAAAAELLSTIVVALLPGLDRQLWDTSANAPYALHEWRKYGGVVDCRVILRPTARP